MIETNKKYRTRDGHAVRILCTDVRGNDYCVLGLVDEHQGGEVVESWTIDGKYDRNTNSELLYDLIEVSPYDDWNIDDKIWVGDGENLISLPRYFAGVHADGSPLAWSNGMTSFSSNGCPPVKWKYARLASEFTPEGKK